MMALRSCTGLLAAVLIGISGTLAVAQEVPDAHLAIEDPALLPAGRLAGIYLELKERLASGYRLSELKETADYQSWERYNKAPYLSSTHGQRYINSYANSIGKDYGKLPAGGRYPVGTVFAKDSITITSQEKIFPGALFIMEKLPAGANPATADWRYALVNPDGSMSGDTAGEEPELVDYCHACHEVKADEDYVYFVPEEYRAGAME